ncbi:hypothetical protein N7448_010033 [Penicillium atrosanguineum]|uniref:Uncharacterized protein n=1 Tax=Penicillium atrosanguineum TaxID=1132637 RepID=A0A9W9KTP9_9EURO|nr:uncharacterized protein N7443_007250 [Penicillium atrosanguineum]KAJ5118321.1 hypothetical protein N7526_009958 [Penicillium atrosanguineum]KAJ5119364.1 hypothetical protein N7448_010033 [Penicillium atrosanguineum]KAJ5296357.1 hypothetical protein N7443_007250 [Penicillium atrosanguineum]KAJ5299125.1 hypothetical protein N7476_010682 [Penicillium atrosanguineum]
MFLIVGRIIGTGIFSTPSSVTSSAGSVGAALLLWVLGFLLAGAGLCVWLELGCMMPRSGGEKVYLEAVYHKPKLLITVVLRFEIPTPVSTTRSQAHRHQAALRWSNAAYVSNEIRNPVRTLKIAAAIGLSICGMLFLLANVAYYAAATPEEIAASGTTVAAFFMGKVFGSAAERAIGVLVAISSFGTVMTVTYSQARVNQELAKEGVVPFPKFWASTWPFGSPSSGLPLHFIPSFIVIVAIPFGDAYNFILDLEGYPSSVINFLLSWVCSIFDGARQTFLGHSRSGGPSP